VIIRLEDWIMDELVTTTESSKVVNKLPPEWCT